MHIVIIIIIVISSQQHWTLQWSFIVESELFEIRYDDLNAKNILVVKFCRVKELVGEAVEIINKSVCRRNQKWL